MNKQIQILFDQDNVKLVVKPAGMLVHPAPGIAETDLISELDLASGWGPLTRLDKQASGLVLLALDQGFKQVKIIRKTYLAEVWGHTPAFGNLDFDITTKRSSGKLKQKAASKYEEIAINKNTTTLSLNINTGRHHQIRKHLRYFQHPIVGDYRHGWMRSNLALADQIGGRPQLMLCCNYMELRYLDKVYEFRVDLPPFWAVQVAACDKLSDNIYNPID